MGKSHTVKFLTQYGLKEDTVLTLTDIATLTGEPYEKLLTVFQRAKVYEYVPATQFSFHKKARGAKPVSDKKALEVVIEFLMGKVKDSDKDLLATNIDAVNVS
jgi:hypothetical protein